MPPSELRMQIMGINVFVDPDADPYYCRISNGKRSVICAPNVETSIRRVFDVGLRALGPGVWDSTLRVELGTKTLVLVRGHVSIRDEIEDGNLLPSTRAPKLKKKKKPTRKLMTKPKGRKIVLDNGA